LGELQLLYELGCEKDRTDQARICILLSFERSYSRTTFKNEQWILEGRRCLDALDDYHVSEPTTLEHDELQQRRLLRCCWLVRALGLIVTLKQTSQPDILTITTPQISLADLEDDLTIPGLLSTETKHTLAEMFLARVALARDSIALCRLLLWWGTAPSPDDRGTVFPSSGYKSVLGDIEQAEMPLGSWRRQYSKLLAADFALTKTETDRGACLLHQSMLKLSYE
jgi:hypothetical protein